MESIAGIKLPDRFEILYDWLEHVCQLPQVELLPMTPDASMRRYYRIKTPLHSYVLMDAPPPEKCAPYVEIANCLRAHGLQAPRIYHANLDDGFLLVSDFGDTTYLKALQGMQVTGDFTGINHLYEQALDALHRMSKLKVQRPAFDAAFMQHEWLWHQEWFLQKYLNAHVDLDNCMQVIIDAVVEQPLVFMHRDYHAANIMVLPNAPGILDFQDAFMGPVTYDLVSLLRDCYISWPQERVQAWINYYFTKNDYGVDAITRERWFDMMGLQRHLKALMTFARKKVRDNQSQYLKHIPRTLKYVVDVSKKYAELKEMHEFYRDRVYPICGR